METAPASKALAAALARQVGGNAKEADATQHDYVAKHGKTQPHYTAERYALRKQPDAMSAWLERARQAAAADVAAPPCPATHCGVTRTPRVSPHCASRWA